jgi:hypothetical protein
VEYDFADDAREVRALLGDAVEVYLQSRRRAPAEHPAVTRVELALLPGDRTAEPTLYVDFDTRPGASWDGDANYGCIAEVSRPGWKALFDAGDGLVGTLPDGSVVAAPQGEGEFGEEADDVVARFLIAALEGAREEGVFDRAAEPGVARAALRLTLTYNGNPVWEDPRVEE